MENSKPGSEQGDGRWRIARSAGSTVRGNLVGFGRTVGRHQPSSGAAVQYGTTEMAKLECVVNDDQVDTIVGLIQQAARTGNAGDGKIFVYNIERTVKIRTGERLQQIE